MRCRCDVCQDILQGIIGGEDSKQSVDGVCLVLANLPAPRVENRPSEDVGATDGAQRRPNAVACSRLQCLHLPNERRRNQIKRPHIGRLAAIRDFWNDTIANAPNAATMTY